MKRTDRIRKEGELVLRKIREIIKHIRNVQDNALILGEKLIESGEVELGKHLIANSFLHDVSKFHGIEFEFMAPGEKYEEENAKLKLKLAIHNHRITNSHHPEAWSGGITDMPNVFLAEMVCDLKARSEEFGTCLMDYIDNVGLKRWDITKESECYKKIVRFVNLLCPKPFESIPSN